MKHSQQFSTLMAAVAVVASCVADQAGAESVAGIQLYPGASSSNVEGSENFIKSSGYRTAVCRHTTDSLDKVVAFYRNDKQLSPMGEPSKDNAGFSNKGGASMSINSPWMNMQTFQMTNGTMICIASKNAK
jgi:hypothetical protein